VFQESYEFGIDHGPFLNIKVKELLWGYPSVLASMGRVQQLGCGGVKQNTKVNAGWDDFGGLDDDWGDSADSWKSDGKTRTRKQVERNVRDWSRYPIYQYGIGEDRGSGFDDRVAQQEDVGLLDDARVQRRWRERSGQVMTKSVFLYKASFINNGTKQ